MLMTLLLRAWPALVTGVDQPRTGAMPGTRDGVLCRVGKSVDGASARSDSKPVLDSFLLLYLTGKMGGDSTSREDAVSMMTGGVGWERYRTGRSGGYSTTRGVFGFSMTTETDLGLRDVGSGVI